MIKFRLLFVFCLLSLSLSAQHVVVGKVINEKGQPFSYASVYFKQIPEKGTVSDNDGRFEIEVHEHDSLVVSFIGCATVTMHARACKDSMTITLREQPIMLDEMVVSVPSKQRNKRKQMAELLKFVRARMELDFPEDNQKYRIHSSAILKSEGEVVGDEQVVADIVELHGKGQKGTDSIQIHGISSKLYVNERVAKRLEETLEGFDSKDKDMFNSLDQHSVLHKLLWGGSVKQMFDELAKSPKKWSVTRDNGDVSVLTYNESKNFLGIVKADITISYVINGYTYALQSISESADINVNIPISYKLKKEELQMLNVLTLATDDIEKFRLKRATCKVKRNVSFVPSDENSLRVNEKHLTCSIVAQDNKGKTLKYNSQANTRVISHKRHAQAFSNRELRKTTPRELVNK